MTDQVGEPRDSGAPEPTCDEREAPQEGTFGDAAGEMSAETEVEASLAQAVDPLAEAQTALAERTSDLQRLQAEYLNYKRRVDRDRDLVRENAVFAVLSGLLPVLDDIDRAREHGELEGGFKAVAESLTNAVSGLGLSRFAEVGEEFDPTIHEALMVRPNEEATNTTIDVVAQTGYRIGDRVVRPAKVTVIGPA